MTQKQFEAEVKNHGFTLEQLRCDVPPTQELLEFMDRVGEKYEKFVMKMQARG